MILAASYDNSVTLDANALEPMITYGTNPGMGMPITGRVPDPAGLAERSAAPPRWRRRWPYMGLVPWPATPGHPVDVIFIGSCTN